MALLCSAQGNVTQALKVCEIGWKTTVTKLTQLQTSQDYPRDGEESNVSTNVDSLSALESIKTKSKFRWDLVSRANREELIRYTKYSIFLNFTN